jgi:hypothetical protein
MQLKLKEASYQHRVLTSTGTYPKTPAVMIDTGHGMVEKVQPRIYRVGSCQVTSRP